MKRTIQLLSVFSLFFIALLFNACEKPKKPNPCDKPVEVLANDPAMFYLGHFTLNDPNQNGFTVSQTYLRAVNYNKFASKFIPGRKYLLGFKYVECKDNSGFCGTDNRCGTPILKCIEILCVKDVPAPSCFGVQFNSPDFSTYYSRAVRDSRIENHSLKTTVYFSGCSAQDLVNFRLDLQEMPLQKPMGPPVYEGKVVEVNNGFTCQAVFTKEACFDLSGLASRYLKNNIAGPKEIIIRLYEGGEVKELLYQVVK